MAHLTVAASEGALKKSVDVLVESVKWEKADSVDFGPFTAGYHVKGHLEGGTLDLRADNTIEIKELDIKWDKLQVSLGLDIPENLRRRRLPRPPVPAAGHLPAARVRLQRRSRRADRARLRRLRGPGDQLHRQHPRALLRRLRRPTAGLQPLRAVAERPHERRAAGTGADHEPMAAVHRYGDGRHRPLRLPGHRRRPLRERPDRCRHGDHPGGLGARRDPRRSSAGWPTSSASSSTSRTRSTSG